MHVRSLKRADIPSLVTMTIECDKTDALADYLLHDQDRYPTSLRRGIWYFIRSKVAGDSGTIAFVLETDAEDYVEPRGNVLPCGNSDVSDQNKSEVIGVAIWTRHGSSPVARSWQKRARGGVFDMVERMLLAIEERYNAFFPSLNPTLNREHLNHLPDEKWDPEIFPEYWHLELLQVHPQWQRRGLSKLLLRWGLERAQEELVPITLTASAIGNLVYRSAGFKSVGYCGPTDDTMVKSTQIARLDGLMLAASVDDEQVETELAEVKSQAKMIFRRLNRNSEQQASIESGQYSLHYIIKDSVCFLCICDRSYPRKLAFTYLSDLAQEFTTIYPSPQYLSATLRPYAFVEFDTFIQRTKKTYQDSRASANLDKLNDELKDVTKVMTKNIEDLLYRGDSLERMGEMSGRLREDSKKYRKAAVRINWELMLKQYGPFAGLGLIMLIFIIWRFF
ncbi:uncharacterized protein Z518_00494 [Rhinocladiella mackenziei CBS 650.93]|uniref:Protein transport protein SEC22 n=1 Tax=Rhinocladiella mackenziei CBS 650.93 TaxID=1442369 RepID=A0A0D2ITK0_9EURO|nr:uncharacterized protein Z518_00494 [Rhinocladiella mackenziei CBS 650.93]KIX09414.1 hypothetical protein Z518_00494 [Rhinocladiella mackenziei CBS 650.93]